MLKKILIVGLILIGVAATAAIGIVIGATSLIINQGTTLTRNLAQTTAPIVASQIASTPDPTVTIAAGTPIQIVIPVPSVANDSSKSPAETVAVPTSLPTVGMPGYAQNATSGSPSATSNSQATNAQATIQIVETQAYSTQSAFATNLSNDFAPQKTAMAQYNLTHAPSNH